MKQNEKLFKNHTEVKLLLGLSLNINTELYSLQLT